MRSTGLLLLRVPPSTLQLKRKWKSIGFVEYHLCLALGSFSTQPRKPGTSYIIAMATGEKMNEFFPSNFF
jgi:hypothetical protein